MKKTSQVRFGSVRNILFVHYGDQWIRGSEVCLLNLMTSLSNKFNPILWTNNDALHQRTIEENIQSHYEEFSVLFGWLSPKLDFSATWQLVRQACSFIREYDIQLIHVNSAAPNQWVVLAAYLMRVPLTTQLHCHYNLRDRAGLLLHLCPHIITVSKAVSLGMLQDGYPSSQLSVIYNGVAHHHHHHHSASSLPLSVKEKLAIPQCDQVLISVGSLIVRKGFDRLIHALHALSNKAGEGPNVHLVIIGDGPCRKPLSSLVRRLKLEHLIHFVGEQSNVQHWLAGGCDAFISGARSEAFGLVLIEAAFAKLPIIAPNVGGIPEVIHDQQSGILYDSSQSEDGIAHAISQVLQNKKYAKMLANNAFERANTHFSLEANTNAIESLYDSILSRRSAVHQSRVTQLSRVISALYRPVRTFLISRFKHLATPKTEVMS
ncbi:glycosyltransferase [Vibrio alfacsensis]|uniref:glycosyltransferase n=1 Tax=Vibrio alfacsensis TaxID=1074311 RepID=UPI001C7ED921|nr:glycosyltransferase [Vibrio alfacsensis]